MADRTVQILPGGQSAAPFTYTVPASTSFTLLAVRAVFDGSGAAGNFVPLVQLVSDAGVVMAQRKGDSVTAGASADVTFAPFDRSASGGGGTDPLAVHFNTDPQANNFLTAEATQAGTAITLKATGGGAFNISATGSAANSVVDITADAQVFTGSPAITERIGVGGDYIVQNHTGVTIIDIWEAGNVEIHLANGKPLTVFDHSGNQILRVDEGGGGAPGYHIKTGGAWVADL